MENTFQRLCQFYLNEIEEKNKKDYKDIVAQASPEQNEKAKELVKKLKEKVNKLGFNTDFSSFCDMIEHYIKNKKDFNYNKKIEYLKVLISLSKVYGINLREELSRYSTPRKEEQNYEETSLFYRFCRYNLEPNNNVDEFNNLKKIKNCNFNIMVVDNSEIKNTNCKICKENSISYLSITLIIC